MCLRIHEKGIVIISTSLQRSDQIESGKCKTSNRANIRE